MLIYLSLSIWAILICFFYDLKVAISIPEKNSFTWFSLLCCAMFYMEFIFIVWIDHWHYLRKSCTVTLKNQILRWIIYIFTNHFLLFNLYVVNKILLTFLSIDSFLSTSHFWLRDILTACPPEPRLNLTHFVKISTKSWCASFMNAREKNLRSIIYN